MYHVFSDHFNQIPFMNISWLRIERNQDIVEGSVHIANAVSKVTISFLLKNYFTLRKLVFK